MAIMQRRQPYADPFRHEALFYTGIEDFIDQTAPFVAEGVANDEAVLVVVDREKIELLRRALGDDAARVQFAEMRTLGRNPAWIIPEWQSFLDAAVGSGKACRGIGEPITPSRRPAELPECERHEELLNVAFSGTDWRLLCPYDLEALPAEVLERAERTHPLATRLQSSYTTSAFPGVDELASPFDAPLPPPPIHAARRVFDAGDAAAIRADVSDRGASAGLSPTRVEELVIAVHELAMNSIRHGGGRGELMLWESDGAIVCEVRDAGTIADPLAGRVRPALGGESGYGLWIVTHLSDLVQIRTTPSGSAVRITIHDR